MILMYLIIIMILIYLIIIMTLIYLNNYYYDPHIIIILMKSYFPHIINNLYIVYHNAHTTTFEEQGVSHLETSI